MVTPSALSALAEAGRAPAPSLALGGGAGSGALAVSPGGGSLGFTTTWAQQTLNATGTYTLRVKESRLNFNPGTRRGTYDLRLEWIAPVSKQCTAAPIPCEQTKTATLGTVEENLYTFSGAAADVVWVSVLTTAALDAGFVEIGRAHV